MEIPTLHAEKIFSLGPIDFTNSLITTLLIFFLLILTAYFVGKKISIKNPGRLQLFLEWVVDGLRSTSEASVGKKNNSKIFPLTLTFFLFIVLSNWFGILPITGPIGFLEKKESTKIVETVNANSIGMQPDDSISDHKELASLGDCLSGKCILDFNTLELIKISEDKMFVPLFRPATSDLNATIALGLFSFLITNIWGFKINKLSYLKKYINFSSPINFFTGILETVLEFAKIISFSFRLFGNVFAGEVLLLVMFSLGKGVVSIPFLILETFVGFVQAYVFFMLTTAFLGQAVAKQEH